MRRRSNRISEPQEGTKVKKKKSFQSLDPEIHQSSKPKTFQAVNKQNLFCRRTFNFPSDSQHLMMKPSLNARQANKLCSIIAALAPTKLRPLPLPPPPSFFRLPPSASSSLAFRSPPVARRAAGLGQHLPNLLMQGLLPANKSRSSRNRNDNDLP